MKSASICTGGLVVLFCYFPVGLFHATDIHTSWCNRSPYLTTNCNITNGTLMSCNANLTIYQRTYGVDYNHPMYKNRNRLIIEEKPLFKKKTSRPEKVERQTQAELCLKKQEIQLQSMESQQELDVAAHTSRQKLDWAIIDESRKPNTWENVSSIYKFEMPVHNKQTPG